MSAYWYKCDHCAYEIAFLKARQAPNCDRCKQPLIAIQQLSSFRTSQAMKTTTELPPIYYKIPTSIEEVLVGTASFAGLSAVTRHLSCPEQSRLKSIGVRRHRRELDLDFIDISEDALSMGSVVHALRATRLVGGMDAVNWVIGQLRIDHASKLKLFHMMKMYDVEFPLGGDQWDYLGIEVEVITDIGDGRGGSCIRSVRYDTLIRHHHDGALFSFEAKTASRSGENQLSQYFPQACSHTALWNSNKELVAKYGEMKGTIYDLLVKTEVPAVSRLKPRYISKVHQQLAIDYLRLPDHIRFPQSSDGASARMLHSCWGRYQPCEYTGLCYEQAYGDYVFPEPQHNEDGDVVNPVTGEVL